MPIYEYQCEPCEQSDEKLQHRDEPPPLCQKCGMGMQRLISRTSFALKGNGWAKDGYSTEAQNG